MRIDDKGVTVMTGHEVEAEGGTDALALSCALLIAVKRLGGSIKIDEEEMNQAIGENLNIDYRKGKEIHVFITPHNAAN